VAAQIVHRFILSDYVEPVNTIAA